MNPTRLIIAFVLTTTFFVGCSNGPLDTQSGGKLVNAPPTPTPPPNPQPPSPLPPAPVLTPPVINSASTANGTIGSQFTYQTTATESPTSFANTTPGVTAGLFGDHLTLDYVTGIISGTVDYRPGILPDNQPIPVVFTLTASNSAGQGPVALITFTFNP